MSLVKPLGSAKISNSTEVEVGGNIREMVCDNAAFRQAENSDGEIATSSLTTLLGRVSGNSTHEVDNLIGELQILRKKLQADGNRIQRDIEEYAALSQSVMQLTKIVSDSMKNCQMLRASVDRYSKRAPERTETHFEPRHHQLIALQEMWTSSLGSDHSILGRW